MNLRLLAPKASALAKLRHTPIISPIFFEESFMLIVKNIHVRAFQGLRRAQARSTRRKQSSLLPKLTLAGLTPRKRASQTAPHPDYFPDFFSRNLLCKL